TRTALSELSPQDRVEEIARMLGGIEVTGKAREHAREMLRTHLDLPPDPSPTDKMPALTAKDLLAQAKIAANAAKEPSVGSKDLGVDPRATAAEPRTSAGSRGPAGARGKDATGATQPAKGGVASDKPSAQVESGENAQKSEAGSAMPQTPQTR